MAGGMTNGREPEGVRHWAGCLVLLVCSCDASQVGRAEHAIVNGTEDTGDPAVVALITDDRIECTGALIADRVVVTAAHCVDSYSSDDLSVFFGQSLEDSGEMVGVLDVRQHAAFARGSAPANDIAAVLLDAPSTIPPVPLRREPITDAQIGSQVRLVGFGRTSPTDSAPRLKREGTARLSSFAETTINLVPDPSITCVGDSGGPALLDSGGGERLAGVLSLGTPDCASLSVETRVDAYAATFLDAYVAATEPGVASLGDRCFYDENCASGLCLAAVDLPSLSFCSATCEAPDDCPPSLICEITSGAFGYCRHPTPSPGALGTLCADDYDCATVTSDGTKLRTWCDSPAGGAPDRCTVECEPDTSDCPEGYACERSEHDGGRACFVGAAQGCSCRAARRTAPSGAPLLLILLWPLARRAGKWRAGSRL